MERFFVWVPGAPQPKGRPRFRVFNGHVQTYTPKTTQSYEQLVAERIRAEYPDFRTYNGPVELHIEFHMPVPKSLESRFRYHADLTCPRFKGEQHAVGSPAMLDAALWKPCRMCKPEAVVFWSPQWHTKKPDLDNLEKSIMDGLQRSEVISDDSQVVVKSSAKAYSANPGVMLSMSIPTNA